MWMGEYWSRTGTYDDEYGPTWVPGNSATSVVFNSTAASTILCPLLCTTEKNTVARQRRLRHAGQADGLLLHVRQQRHLPAGGRLVGHGHVLRPDGDQRVDASTSPTASPSKPSVQGAIFAGCPYDPTYTSGLSKSDIVLEDYSTIAYDQTVVGKIATSSLKTTTLVTQTVPGSWQQLPVP